MKHRTVKEIQDAMTTASHAALLLEGAKLVKLEGELKDLLADSEEGYSTTREHLARTLVVIRQQIDAAHAEIAVIEEEHAKREKGAA